jgi:hypothetical protein
MSKIPRTKEWPTRYKMSFEIVMEPWEAFIGRPQGNLVFERGY